MISIHSKINAKANHCPIYDHFYADRERHSEAISHTHLSRGRMIKQHYSKQYILSDHLHYPQDTKTNFREPSEGEAWSGGFADTH